MIRVVRILSACFVLSVPLDASSAEWYVGGTLHKASAKAWRAASYQDRLATSADFAASIKGASDMDDLRESAKNLEHCISEAVADKSTNVPVSQVGAACAVMMGWHKD